MRLLRLTAAGLLWVLACLLGLVGSLLCVTVILIPVGVLLISLARRLFRLSGKLALPRAARHPISELAAKPSRKSLKKIRKSARQKLPGRRRRVLGVKV
jgi:hypothetical protein